MIDSSQWGGVQVSGSPKKTTATFKIDAQGNMVADSYQEVSDDNNKSRLARIQEDRAKKIMKN